MYNVPLRGRELRVRTKLTITFLFWTNAKFLRPKGGMSGKLICINDAKMLFLIDHLPAVESNSRKF